MKVFSNIFNSFELSENTLNMFPDVMAVISPEGKIYSVNKAFVELFRLSTYTLYRTNISNIIENAIQVIDTAISTGKVQVGKALIDGNRLIYLEISAKSHTTSSGTKIIIVLRDVTANYVETAELFDELETLKEIGAGKNDFILNVSNELQSPLHSAIGFSQALLENLGGELTEKQRKYISIINKNSCELLSVIHKIILLSKYESNEIKTDFKNFDLIEIVNNCINESQKNLNSSTSTIITNFENLSKRNCFLDEELLKTLLKNIIEPLLQNLPTGTLRITASTPNNEVLNEFKIIPQGKEKDFVLFTFESNDFAINSNEFSEIFNPYLQAKRENKKYLKTALSFAISKRIVPFLNGIISFEPKGMQGIQVYLIIKTDIVERINNG